jgi:hypothetical protein
MKKVYTLFSVLFVTGSLGLKAQDTLVYEGFQKDSITYISVITSPPPALTADTMWYDFDRDQLNDGSSQNPARPGSWYRVKGAFSNTDLFDNVTGDTNIVMLSNSWFDSPGLADNWLITKNILLSAHDTLFWKSAPRQTPRYCDGYEVLLSTTTNEDLAFSHLLFTAAQMDSILGTNDSIFAGYSFSPDTAFIHGADGTYTEYDADSARLLGVLRTFSVPLDTYAGQNIFIAFHHNSFDDNLIAIDDILIRGTASSQTGVKEKANFDLGLNIFPNPASETAQLNFQLVAETEVTISVSDITGKLVYSENKGSMVQGRHFATINTAALAKGFYTVAVQTSTSRNTTKLVVK